MKKLLSIFLGICISVLTFAQNFPFPMNEQGYEYPYGISASTPNNEKIQACFTDWEDDMWEESGEYGRIKFDDSQYTVSEGIAYGMLIYVYMANETNTQCQDHFDKLYAYYKKWSDSRGLMNWKIQGFSSINGYNAATDADVDVALALCLAAKQWGSSSNYDYATEAETILKNIYNNEVTTKNGLKVFKPGDSWDNYGNPCYFTVASVGVYKQAQEELGFSTTKDWATVYTDAHTYLEKSQKAGVWPNWAKWDGSLGTGNSDGADDFGWDACRVPWRIAWDYVWFGNESSKNMLSNTIALLDTKGWAKSPGSVGFMTGLSSNSYSAISIKSDAGNVAWTGSVGSAFMTDESRQSNLDTYYKQQTTASAWGYYGPTLRVLYMLLLSGNAANFYDCDGGATPTVVAPTITAATTDGSVITLTSSKKMTSSSDYSGFTVYVNGNQQSNVISSMSVSGTTITLNLKNLSLTSTDIVSISYDGTNLTSEQDAALGSFVKMAVKNNISGGSTLLADCEDGKTTLLGGSWYSYVGDGTASYEIVSGGANSTAHSAMFTYSNITDYAGMGFSIQDGDAETDCSGSTGISFYHKGDAATLEVGAAIITDYSYHTFSIPSHSDWTLMTLSWDEIADAGWGQSQELDFVSENLSSQITKFQWKVTSGSGSLSIDEFTLIGRDLNSSVDRTALEATQLIANALYSTATTETYPQTAITTFKNAIDAAATVHDTPTATQTEIDNANTTLTAAIATFKATAYADKTPLAKAIATATNLSSSAVIGTADGNYPQSAKDELDAAIAAAQNIYNMTELTSSQVNETVSDLQDAVTAFQASKISLVDKSDLEYLITTVTNILNTTTVGTEVGQYPKTIRTKLESALSNAKITYNNESATQSAVDTKTQELKTAYNNYMAAKITSTAIDEFAISMNVFPNPCSNELHIESNDVIASVSIFGLTGFKMNIAVDATEAIIDVTALPVGMYVAQCVAEDGSVATVRFVKK